MNQSELAALSEPDLSPFVVSLYVRCFRKNMDYRTGEVLVSLAGMRRAMEFVPARGSTLPPDIPSKDKLRHGVDVLVRCGLVRLVRKGDIRRNLAAVYCCALASFNDKRGFSAQFEEPHGNPTGTPREQNSLKLSFGEACSENVVFLKKTDEPHRPDLPEQEYIYTREALVLDAEFRALANLVGLVCSDDVLSGYFDAFRYQAKAQGVCKSLAGHKGDWKQFCAYTKANNVRASDETSKRAYSKSNKTNHLLRGAFRAAQSGVDCS